MRARSNPKRGLFMVATTQVRSLSTASRPTACTAIVAIRALEGGDLLCMAA